MEAKENVWDHVKLVTEENSIYYGKVQRLAANILVEGMECREVFRNKILILADSFKM